MGWGLWISGAQVGRLTFLTLEEAGLAKVVLSGVG
jgi:hypothetical protein